jgi:hypothetical protein
LLLTGKRRLKNKSNHGRTTPKKGGLTMKMFTKTTFTMILALMLLSVGTLFADTPAKKLDTPKVTVPTYQIDPAKLKLKTDLVVESIYGLSCICDQDLGRVDAFLMNELWVTLGNWPCSDGAKANATGRLKVTYFDLTAGSMVNRTISFTLSGNSRQAIKITNGYLLVKKSSGIKAEIIEINSPVTDCNPSNNSKTVYRCEMPPIY